MSDPLVPGQGGGLEVSARTRTEGRVLLRLRRQDKLLRTESTGTAHSVLSPHDAALVLGGTATPKKAFGGALVLLVDDDRDCRELVGEVLQEELGVRVAVAGDGHDALRQVGEALPHLILLNLRMPRMSGFEVLRQLKSDPATWAIPVIALTGFGDSRTRERVRQAGCDDYIGKPFDLDLLEDTVRAWLQRGPNQDSVPLPT